MNDLVELTICNTRIEAEIVRGKLETSNIDAFITADDAGGLYSFPFQSGFSGVQVLVRKKDLKTAKKLLFDTK